MRRVPYDNKPTNYGINAVTIVYDGQEHWGHAHIKALGPETGLRGIELVFRGKHGRPTLILGRAITGGSMSALIIKSYEQFGKRYEEFKAAMVEKYHIVGAFK